MEWCGSKSCRNLSLLIEMRVLSQNDMIIIIIILPSYRTLLLLRGLIIIDLPTKFKINLYLLRVHFVLRQCVLSKVFRKSNRRNFIILKGISFLNSRPWMIKRREFQPSGKHWIIIMIVDTIWQWWWWRWLNDKHQSYSHSKSCLSLFSNIMYHGT